jgi:hypothetical protein
MRFGTWNVRSLYKPGSLATVASKLVRYKLDLVGIQEVMGGGGGQWGSLIARDYIFFYRKEIKIINSEQNFLYSTEQL